MRVLVTGGAGYIGSHTAHLLRARGDDVVVLDSLATGHRAAVGDLPLVVGDIRDEALVASVVRERAIEAVIHFAALKSVEASVGDPFGYFDVNVTGTMTLARAAVAGGVDRMVFSSSCAVYGQPDRLPIDERCRVAPENPYGHTKLAAEGLLASLEAATGLRTVALRYFNAAGASQDGSSGEDWSGAVNLIPSVLRVAAGREAVVRVFGTDFPTPDGTAVRDYVHVSDLADAHARALDHLAAGGPSITVNVGTGRGWSVREVDHRRGGGGRPSHPDRRRRSSTGRSPGGLGGRKACIRDAGLDRPATVAGHAGDRLALASEPPRGLCGDARRCLNGRLGRRRTGRDPCASPM